MRIMPVKNSTFVILLTQDEVYILAQALNEVCNGIEVPEFSTRMGASVEEVRELLNEFITARDHSISL